MRADRCSCSPIALLVSPETASVAIYLHFLRSELDAPRADLQPGHPGRRQFVPGALGPWCDPQPIEDLRRERATVEAPVRINAGYCLISLGPRNVARGHCRQARVMCSLLMQGTPVSILVPRRVMTVDWPPYSLRSTVLSSPPDGPELSSTTAPTCLGGRWVG